MAVPDSITANGLDTPKDVAVRLAMKNVPLLAAFTMPVTVMASPIARAEKLVNPLATEDMPVFVTLAVHPPESFRLAAILKLGLLPCPFQLKQARLPCFSILNVLPVTVTKLFGAPK